MSALLRWFATGAAAAVVLLLAPDAWSALSPAQVAYWQALHRCEQPSGWHGGFPKYPGGLGILAANWTTWAGELGLLAQYPTGADASPRVQMRVASWAYRVWRDGQGRRPGWGCFATVGRPPA